MPFPRPTYTDLRTQAANDIDAGLPGTDVRLRYSNLNIIGIVLAGLANGHYGYLDWIAANATPFTATGEFLDAWAALKGVIRKAATSAAGIATFPAAGTVTVPAGTPLVRSSDGAAYVSTADAVSSGGSVNVPFAAVTPGSAGDALAGAAMVLGIGISGVGSSGACTDPISGGDDVELDDPLRTRMLAAYAEPAQGGSFGDYENWARAVPGVTRAWARRTVGLGTVTVYVMFDSVRSAESGFPQGFDGVATDEDRDTPATGDQLLVANALYELQPVTPIVYVAAPLHNDLTLTIAGLSGATTAVQAAITAAVKMALLVGAQPGGVTNVSVIEAAIAGVTGSAGFVLTNIAASAGTVTPSSAGNITSNTGCLPVLSSITWS